MGWWKLRARVGYWLARKLFNQRWAVENNSIWNWMQTQFSRMAGFNDSAAQAFYGHLLLHKGQGMGARNEGVRLLGLAAQGGDAKAAYQLAVHALQDDLQHPVDAEKAAEWLELAMQQGHPLAGIKLLELYNEGPEPVRDADKAERVRQQLGEHPLL